MPIAMTLLSWGWNARKVAAGGGGINVVIVCGEEENSMLYPAQATDVIEELYSNDITSSRKH